MYKWKERKSERKKEKWKKAKWTEKYMNRNRWDRYKKEKKRTCKMIEKLHKEENMRMNKVQMSWN